VAPETLVISAGTTNPLPVRRVCDHDALPAPSVVNARSKTGALENCKFVVTARFEAVVVVVPLLNVRAAFPLKFPASLY
jgi:hypothetical protein